MRRLTPVVQIATLAMLHRGAKAAIQAEHHPVPPRPRPVRPGFPCAPGRFERGPRRGLPLQRGLMEPLALCAGGAPHRFPSRLTMGRGRPSQGRSLPSACAPMGSGVTATSTHNSRAAHPVRPQARWTAGSTHIVTWRCAMVWRHRACPAGQRALCPWAIADGFLRALDLFSSGGKDAVPPQILAPRTQTGTPCGHRRMLMHGALRSVRGTGLFLTLREGMSPWQECT